MLALILTAGHARSLGALVDAVQQIAHQLPTSSSKGTAKFVLQTVFRGTPRTLISCRCVWALAHEVDVDHALCRCTFHNLSMRTSDLGAKADAGIGFRRPFLSHERHRQYDHLPEAGRA